MVPKKLTVIYEVIKKEYREYLRTKRLWIIALLFFVAIILISCYYGYKLKSHPMEMVSDWPFGILTSTLPVILAIALSYDTIAGERTRKSLILLLSKPVDRESIFVGKFLATAFVLSICYILFVSFGYWLEAGLAGKMPSAKDVGNTYAVFGVVLLGVLCWIGFTMFFSSIFRTPSTALIIVVLMWIIVLPLLTRLPIAYYMFESMTENPPPGNQQSVSYPSYVIALYALSPDNCVLDAIAHILSTNTSFHAPILTLPQALAALIIFLFIVTTLSIVVFKKISVD